MTHGMVTGDRPQMPCLVHPSSLCRGQTPETWSRAASQRGQDGAGGIEGAGWLPRKVRSQGCVPGGRGMGCVPSELT